jgi:hypothetical protein
VERATIGDVVPTSNTDDVDAPVAPLSTIVVVPRQMFSETTRSLGSILEHSGDRPVVVVDGGSPRRTRRRLERLAADGAIRHLRTEHLLLSNEARALAMGHVHTRYVVFVDNDVSATPGWVDALERCAEETGADVVGPVIGIGDDPDHPEVHWAAGPCHVAEVDGRRVLVTDAVEQELSLADARALGRSETELVEFHAVLLRLERVAEVGGLDPALNTREHCDLCMRVRDRGGRVWVEPSSFVVHVLPTRVPFGDRRQWVFRWDESLSAASLARFATAWQLPPDDRFLERHARWIRTNRARALPFACVSDRVPHAVRPAALRAAGVARVAGDAVARRTVVAAERRRRRRSGVNWPLDLPALPTVPEQPAVATGR